MRIEYSQTKTNPYLLFDSESGVLKIIGRSSPSDTIGFYEPVLQGLQKNISQTDKLLIDIKLEYFNSSTAKYLFNIFREVKLLVEKGLSAEVNWHVETDDLDVLETGEDFQELTGIIFQFHFY